MSNDRPPRDSMSLEEATVSNHAGECFGCGNIGAQGLVSKGTGHSR